MDVVALLTDRVKRNLDQNKKIIIFININSIMFQMIEKDLHSKNSEYLNT